MDRELFLRMIRESPALGYRVTKVIGLRLRTFRIRVEELLYKSAHARVAHTLIDLGKQYGVTDAAGMTIPVRVNQRDLGALVGLTRETVNGILQDLRQRVSSSSTVAASD